MEKVGHLNTQKQRLFRKFDVEYIVRAVIGNHREVGLLFERLNADLTRNTFFAPSAIPATRFSLPRSQYTISAGKIMWVVLLWHTSRAWGGIILSKTTFSSQTVELVAVGEVGPVPRSFRVRQPVLCQKTRRFCVIRDFWRWQRWPLRRGATAAIKNFVIVFIRCCWVLVGVYCSFPLRA